MLQSFWPYRLHLRRKIRKWDRLVLVLLAEDFLLTLTVVDVHLGFMAAYAVILAILGFFVFVGKGKEMPDRPSSLLRITW